MNMAKAIAIVGGLIAVLGPLLGIYIDALGLWNYSSTIVNITTTQRFDVLGTYYWQIGNWVASPETNQTIQVLGILILIGGAILLVGGLTGSRAIAAIGGVIAIVGAVVFALMLQGILDADYFYISDYSIYLTYNQSIFYDTTVLTQMLGGGFWTAVIGGGIGLVGALTLKK
jgi:hypothetical protein